MDADFQLSQKTCNVRLNGAEISPQELDGEVVESPALEDGLLEIAIGKRVLQNELENSDVHIAMDHVAEFVDQDIRQAGVRVVAGYAMIAGAARDASRGYVAGRLMARTVGRYLVASPVSVADEGAIIRITARAVPKSELMR